MVKEGGGRWGLWAMAELGYLLIMVDGLADIPGFAPKQKTTRLEGGFLVCGG
jgi:hypothetical protein